MDVERLRADFPILSRKVRGKRLVYLDNAATTQRPQVVIDSLVRFYSNYNSNVHRSVHTLGEEATAAYEGSRKKTAAFVGARPQDLVFVRGTTEATNLVSFAWGDKNMKKGDVIVVTTMEHHSNIVPWQMLAKRSGAILKYVGLNPDGTLDLGSFEALLREAPRLVAFTHCSNVLGTINDAAKLCAMAKEAGATTLVDGAQAVPHMPVDVGAIDSDFYAFSGHKMLGPTGIGALVARRGLLEEMDPFQTGGEMIREVFDDHSTWNDIPYKFEAGTVNIADGIALGAAVDYLESIGMERVRAHEVSLLDYAMNELTAIRGIRLYGPMDTRLRAGVISFNYADVHPHDLATILDEEGVAIRSGHHCAQPLMRWLDVPAASRASFYVYNSHDDVDALKLAIEKAGRIFKV
ncbi:MAG: cysteine desulfurase [Nitrososphaerota archaeon]|nr:cysteine desulfurase [Nitrososphaerota archaeon]MDG6912100.1 cysteine desulfurase [Nitrososphaerota archaeon]MDG6924720.1 cysteine desulfurase [Nitrososphaerota archaeon]MDG6940917.1 cysteine desulfurase [Nitrososphaerota archaeon]MDG6945112.1 cysteine desulfurase [Nitrososphaerota archaeon]